MELNILNRINSPKDLKALNQEDLPLLADEIRQVIIEKVTVWDINLNLLIQR